MQRHVCVYIRGSVKSYKEMRAKEDSNMHRQKCNRVGGRKNIWEKREKDICALVLKIYYTDEKAVGGRKTRGNRKK